MNLVVVQCFMKFHHHWWGADFNNFTKHWTTARFITYIYTREIVCHICISCISVTECGKYSIEETSQYLWCRTWSTTFAEVPTFLFLLWLSLIFTSAKEVMFSSMSLCLFICQLFIPNGAGRGRGWEKLIGLKWQIQDILLSLSVTCIDEIFISLMWSGGRRAKRSSVCHVSPDILDQ